MRNLSLEWTRNLKDPKRKEDFEKTLRNSTVAINRLLEILDEWEEELDKEESSRSNYGPGWDYQQAHRNGDRSRLRKLRDLLGFMK